MFTCLYYFAYLSILHVIQSMAEERDSNKKRPRDERTQNEDTVHLELFTTQLAQNNTELQTNPNNTRLQWHSDFSERNPRREGLSTRCFADQGYITRTSHMLLFLGVVCVLGNYLQLCFFKQLFADFSVLGNYWQIYLCLR